MVSTAFFETEFCSELIFPPSGDLSTLLYQTSIQAQEGAEIPADANILTGIWWDLTRGMGG